ncbi:osmotically inducible protein Y precursor [Aquitalea magnusonii]|jgi:osmotically-inducible protein OsmY|uniref:Osmotically inducible protein Y n=1 Tax=Aquitalea magnusonii TaxID=332411 RepID=A0A3G9GD58_9NEIS|nr:BON domain-containing protein [Aquitalea magnusonii]BBF85800.1 osmotically inducible protein Y precursor [Aquitalea magnusonii]
MLKTDTTLQSDVMAELAWDPQIYASHIGVQAKDGVITLSGEVADFTQKWAAERAALRVGGVQALAVELTVALPWQEQRSDGEISAAAANALHMVPVLKDHAIKVMVEHGWITLSGEVEWDFQRKTAISLLRHLAGVTGISNQITLRSKLLSQAIKEEVEAALKRRAIRDINSITVSIDGPDVILSGSVHSWSERALANHAAAGMPGVRDVIDKISVLI